MQSPSTPSAIAITPAETLSHRTARGFAWMLSQSLLTKVVTTLGQIVIAWFLLPADFGLTAIAYMFSIVPTLIQQGGLREVLVARYPRFHLWANAALWMSLALGLAGGAVMAVMAPFAAEFYGEPRLVGLLLIIALLYPLEAINLVSMAHIQGSMRFRLAASVSMGQSLTQTVLSIVFAMLGFGPYSLILPRPIISIGTSIVYWTRARPPVHLALQARRWRYLIGDSGRVIVANACELVMHFAGYFVLSVTADTMTVGHYFFAFNLSMQTHLLVTLSLGGVLFPALSSLQHDPQRQVHAFLRSLRVVSCIAVPACLLQAAAAEPAMRLAFPDTYEPSIQLVQILSIGMALRSMGFPAVSLLQAQGRFTARLLLSVISVCVLMAMVLLGAQLRGAAGVAVGTTIHMLVMEPVFLRVAIGPLGRGWFDLIKTIGPTLVLAVGTIGPAWLVSRQIPATLPASDWIRCAVLLLIAGALYLPLFRLLVPSAYFEGRARVLSLLRIA